MQHVFVCLCDTIVRNLKKLNLLEGQKQIRFWIFFALTFLVLGIVVFLLESKIYSIATLLDKTLQSVYPAVFTVLFRNMANQYLNSQKNAEKRKNFKKSKAKVGIKREKRFAQMKA